jgi:hypothetical protein
MEHVGTHWNQRKMKKNPSHPKLKWGKKKQGTLSACLGLPIGCIKFLFPKEFITIFGQGNTFSLRTPYLISVRAKLVANKFKNLNPDQPMRRCTMHPISNGIIFLLEGGRGCE